MSVSRAVLDKYVAAKMGDGIVLEHLVLAGATQNAVDKPGHRAGEYAIEAGHDDVAENVTDGGQHIRSHGLQYSVVQLATSQRMLQPSHC